MRTTDGSAEWVENAPGSRARTRHGTELWHARELVGFFALRDLKARYKQAALGAAWVLVQPLATVAAFTLVFDDLAGIGSQGIPYPLFALTGLITWTYFSSAVSRASTVLVADPSLITKVYFPRLAAPTGALLPPLVDLGVSLVLVVLFMSYFDTAPSWQLLAVPVWLFLLVLTASGVSLWLSALNVRYRDVQHAVVPLLQLWLFLSPVAYPSSLLSGWRGLAFALNPMTGVIEFGRWSLLGAPWPGWPLAVSVAVAAVLLTGGSWYFRRAERFFADVI
ncbi:ABC-2 type transport system permease protein/lipopolysaccharide transport system permease protein [Geodermatophilus bullaregiensis]|uniref:ABC transporter permease n=1 Tax=Geodermatophilus bullaregiensis TaxID=1564160 RepID=UPI00195C5DE6|nr:ABC transporter permease [Geodermatophilus bullaregiensis]MBM7804174.1 ABC-2 type transport system permease protein/lipopolysaccharide transport system permease protein [Geodermatophilus bullaregiensis]